MSMHNLGIPDLPARAFVRHGRNIRPQGGGKGSAPETPDYEAAARETAKGNLEAAKYATQANRANQYTPWGNIEWTSDRVFNQDAYDRDLAAYNQARAEYQDMQNRPQGGFSGDYGFNPYQRKPEPVAPNASDYYTGGDKWTQNITLSPEMQQLLDQQNRLQLGMFGAQNAAADRVNESMGQGFDMSGIPQGGQAMNPEALPGMGEVFNPSGGQIAMYDPTKNTNNATDLIMQRLNPELDRQQEALRARLANQGITQGSEAYNTAMSQFGQQRNDAANQAALSGIGLGMQQQGLQFNQGLQNRQLTAGEQAQRFGQQTTNQQLAAALQAQQFGQSSQARQQAMAEQAYLRSLPLNELNALRTGNQVSMPSFPGYSQQAATGGPDMMGAAQQQYSANLGAYNAQQAQSGGLMGGILGIGGGLLGASLGGPQGAAIGANLGQGLGQGLFSDRRLKRNIKRIGRGDNGLSIYAYNYVWGGPTQIGYMADEVEKVAPHAVSEVGGFKTVNYGAI